jgi:hypothetical protein
MEPITPPPPPTTNGINGASPDEMMKVLVRQHRVINSLKDQLGSVLLGLAETQATVDELREDLSAAQSELELNHMAAQSAPGRHLPAE